VIPWYVERGAVVLEDVLDADVFSPIREDWLTGEDHYCRGGIKGRLLFALEFQMNYPPFFLVTILRLVLLRIRVGFNKNIIDKML